MPSDCATIRQCSGLSVAKRLKVTQPRRARWAASRRSGSQHPRTSLLFPTCPASGSTSSTVEGRLTAFGRHGFEPRPAANRRIASGTVITPAPAVTRCSCSTSSAIWKAARCVPGNVHSADGWDGVLKPVVTRNQGNAHALIPGGCYNARSLRVPGGGADKNTRSDCCQPSLAE
jgi:hypothetical protein